MVTVEQSKAQMTMWSMWSAPLIMSNDLRTIAPEYKEVLLNKKVIQVDQDPLGHFGLMVMNVRLTSHDLFRYSFAGYSLL